MATATMTSKGQVTVPKLIRDRLNLREGDRVDFVEEGGKVVLRAHNIRLADLAGILKLPSGMKPLTIEEMNDSIGEAVAADDERIRRDWR